MPNKRQAHRRQHILEVAIELFSRQGFHRTSTRQIAQQAGIAEGTIFNYFSTKKDLLVARMSHGYLAHVIVIAIVLFLLWGWALFSVVK